MGDRNQATVLRERKRKGFSTTTSCCKNKNGDLITNKEEVLIQWEDFFKELLNGNESRTSPQGNQSQKFKNNEDAQNSWTSADFKLLSVYDRGVLQLIFGGVCINGEWGSGYNQELYELYNHPDIVKKIRTRRLRCAEVTREPDG
uniref:Uncharacterized protein n=1 Tax=Megaselia scalaris TaxID=36166 RepID=T1GG09_MEGSC